jgi:hypothetical protein
MMLLLIENLDYYLVGVYLTWYIGSLDTPIWQTVMQFRKYENIWGRLI